MIETNGLLQVGTSASGTVPLAASGVLSVGQDTPFTFVATVRHIVIQNKSTSDVYVDFDKAASLGSFKLFADGGQFSFDIPCTAVHIYGTAATNVNGSSDFNIVLAGWS